MDKNEYHYYTIAFIPDFKGKTTRDYKLEELPEGLRIPEDVCGFELRKHSCDVIKNTRRIEKVYRVVVGRETNIDEILKYVPNCESHSNLYFMKINSKDERFCREAFDADNGKMNPAYMIIKEQDIIVKDYIELQEKYRETIKKKKRLKFNR